MAKSYPYLFKLEQNYLCSLPTAILGEGHQFVCRFQTRGRLRRERYQTLACSGDTHAERVFCQQGGCGGCVVSAGTRRCSHSWRLAFSTRLRSPGSLSLPDGSCAPFSSGPFQTFARKHWMPRDREYRAAFSDALPLWLAKLPTSWRLLPRKGSGSL